jgi:UDP-GlcNAc:undecaprenyl-phosphate/decaprenyl-phosphate GlcNAc-1-phosphate transferase
MIQFAAAITSFTMGLLLFPLVISWLHRLQLTDKPNVRKIHHGDKPSFGGVPVFISFLFSAIVWVNLTEWKYIKYLLLAQIAIIIFGLRDDLQPLRPIYKLIGQFMAATVIIFLFNVRINSLYGFMGIDEIPTALSYLLSFVTIIGITNSFNLIDGVDGLAGTIASIVFCVLGIWFYLIEDSIFSTVAFAMFGALLAFLIFNWQPSKIFMGDTGSLFIGLTLSIFIILFMNVNEGLPVENPFKFHNTITAALCFLMPPLLDTIRVIIIRILKGNSPFQPDKNHIHHVFIRIGFSHQTATLIIAAVHFGFIALAMVLIEVVDKYSVPIVVLASVMFSVLLDRLIMNYTQSGRRSVW